MLQNIKNELLQNILLLAAKDSYSINGEMNNKNALKRGSFKYDILDVTIALGTNSLLYQTWGFYVSYHLCMYICIYVYMYICIYVYIIYLYIGYILYIWDMRYMIYNCIWYGVDDIGMRDIWYTHMVYMYGNQNWTILY